ncbi:degV family protein [Desulfitobacterium hafniense DCB-2]|uniref:DegV family protein n=1 Tax=Desulfitobacterium hafniense (strain DSM 10664 / DCB-2) TaxID=272564 RepID=B8FXC1_DESHD|nr:DegV family protein [Desulfitobacterium hafniense]ACL20840.1 degV family protein [Desulfitobacterium hafniense DCB-2]
MAEPINSRETKIAIVTDSACDLEPELIEEYGIEVVPLHIIYRDREYRDRVDISPQEVYDSLEQEVPKTSLPSPAEIQAVFNRLREQKVTHILSLHLSSGLSGTYQAVSLIAQEFKDMIIEVVDTKTLSMGLGMTVIEAARESRRTVDFEHVVASAKKAVEQIKGYYVLSTLEYLKKGGRIGYVAGTIGELLSLKPIISINEEGKYFTFAKVRGREQSLKRLKQVLLDHLKESIASVAIVHGGSEKEARDLEKVAREHPNVKEVFFGQISPALGVHTGPGLVGLLVYPRLEGSI